MLNFFKARRPLQPAHDGGKNLQLFDLLQMSRLEKESAVLFRRHKRTAAARRGGRLAGACPASRFYHDIEAILLRRQAQDAALVYLLMRRARKESFERYLKDIPCRANDAGMSFVKVS